MYVRLVSESDHVFVVERQIAEISSTIARALASDTVEGSTARIHFKEISSATLETIVQYMHYKHKHSGDLEAPPPFPHIHADSAIDLLQACLFLDV